jgi:hypothetical protein
VNSNHFNMALSVVGDMPSRILFPVSRGTTSLPRSLDCSNLQPHGRTLLEAAPCLAEFEC